MIKKLQLIGGELGIIFTEEETKKYQFVEGDKIDFTNNFLTEEKKHEEMPRL